MTAKLMAWRSHRELQVFLRTSPSRGSERVAAVAEDGGEMKGPALSSLGSRQFPSTLVLLGEPNRKSK